jgi:hypothetical protein
MGHKMEGSCICVSVGKVFKRTTASEKFKLRKKLPVMMLNKCHVMSWLPGKEWG